MWQDNTVAGTGNIARRPGSAGFRPMTRRNISTAAQIRGIAQDAMLKIEEVSKKFRGGNYGARDVSLELKSGVIGLLGPNGAGKTTLMQMIATITRPTSGRIFFHGTDVVKRPNELRRKLGYLPQDFGVYDNLTALEFLSYFAALKAPAVTILPSRRVAGD